MTSSLSTLADNLAERIHKPKCKYGHDNKNVKNVELKENLRNFQKLK